MEISKDELKGLRELAYRGLSAVNAKTEAEIALARELALAEIYAQLVVAMEKCK